MLAQVMGIFLNRFVFVYYLTKGGLLFDKHMRMAEVVGFMHSSPAYSISPILASG